MGKKKRAKRRRSVTSKRPSPQVVSTGKAPVSQSKDTDKIAFKAGDPVVVKPGVRDPDWEADIGGWQGWIISVDPDDDIVTIRWDSITLKNMPAESIRRCEREGLDWTVMNLESHEIEPAVPRDDRSDASKIGKEIEAQHAWDYVGEEGPRIQKVLAGIDPNDELAALDAWDEYLTDHLTFPFEAEVAEFQERGPLQAGDRVTVTGISGLDGWYGIIVSLRAERQWYDFPLCDLEVVDQHSPNYQPVQDYAVWFANR